MVGAFTITELNVFEPFFRFDVALFPFVFVVLSSLSYAICKEQINLI